MKPIEIHDLETIFWASYLHFQKVQFRLTWWEWLCLFLSDDRKSLKHEFHSDSLIWYNVSHPITDPWENMFDRFYFYKKFKTPTLAWAVDALEDFLILSRR